MCLPCPADLRFDCSCSSLGLHDTWRVVLLFNILKNLVLYDTLRSSRSDFAPISRPAATEREEDDGCDIYGVRKRRRKMTREWRERAHDRGTCVPIRSSPPKLARPSHTRPDFGVISDSFQVDRGPVPEPNHPHQD